MIPYNVNSEEYCTSEEYKAIYECLTQNALYRAKALSEKFPEYRIKNRTSVNRDINYHMIEHNVPFYDVICETLLHNGGNGYIDIVEFTYQVNVFAKTIFHRKLWGDTLSQNPDKFLNFVWNNYKSKQLAGEFDRLEAVANKLLENSDLIDYHKEFIINDTYQFITIDESRELFDHLFANEIFDDRIGDLYRVYTGVDYDKVDTDAKTLYHSGKISKIDNLHLESKYKVDILPIMRGIKTKFNFIPLDDPDNMFQGRIVNLKMGGHIRFIPQFLVFYS